jgi:hypothetical protein
MRPHTVTYSPADDDDNGLATTTTAAAGVAFTQIATSAGDDLAHLILITPTGSVTGNYTITGTDANGNAQTEVLATDTTNAVTSVKYYLTVTSVLSPAGIGGESVIIGWTDDVVGPTYVLDWASNNAANIYVDVTGTIDFDIQQTFDNVLAGATASWVAISALDSKTADTYGNAAVGATAFRLLLNSLASTPTIKISTSQAVRR